MSKKIWLIYICIFLFILPAAAYSKDYVVQQNNKAFYYLGKKSNSIVVRAGDKIEFKNIDSVFHNIYSLSKIMEFNLGAFDKGKSKTVVFDKKGTVAVECAFHSRMFIEVVVE